MLPRAMKSPPLGRYLPTPGHSERPAPMQKVQDRMETAGTHDGSWKTELEGHTGTRSAEAADWIRQAKVKHTRSCHQLCPGSRDASLNSADSRCPGSAEPTGP